MSRNFQNGDIHVKSMDMLKEYGFTEQGIASGSVPDKLALVSSVDRDMYIYESLPPVPGMCVKTADGREFIIETVKQDGDYLVVDGLTSLQTGQPYVADDYVLRVFDVPETQLGRAWLNLYAGRGALEKLSEKQIQLQMRLHEASTQAAKIPFLVMDTQFKDASDSVPAGSLQHMWISVDNDISFTYVEGGKVQTNSGSFAYAADALQSHVVDSGMLGEFLDAYRASSVIEFWTRSYDKAYVELIERFKKEL